MINQVHGVILLLATSCGQVSAPSTTQVVNHRAEMDPKIEAARLVYLGELEARGVDVSRTPAPGSEVFQTIDPTLLGLCIFPGSRIELQPDTPKHEDQFRALVDHEVTHCQFGIGDHDPEEGHIFSVHGLYSDEQWSDVKWSDELDRVAQIILAQSPYFTGH